MSPKLLFIWTALLISAPSAFVYADGREKPAAEDAVKALQRQASECMQKAMDYRVMGLNALKNADALRGEAHEAFVSALTNGEADGIEKAKDSLDEASEALVDVIEDVERVIACSVKAETAARRAEDLCKAAPADRGAGDEDEIRTMLDSSAKHLAKADSIARKLRKDWLEPYFASTTTTSTTTSTTQPEVSPEGK